MLITYTLVIGVVLFVVGMALLFFILRNPAIDRQVYNRMEGIADLIMKQGALRYADNNQLGKAVQRIDQQGDVRVLIWSPDRGVILDSRAETAASLPLNFRPDRLLRRGIVLDAGHEPWYYIWRRLGEEIFMVLASPRVGRLTLLFSQRLREVLRDDLLPPLLQGGLAALIIALLLSFWMARWISAPLGRISEAARKISSGEYAPVPVDGPKEVRALAEAFNQMSKRVISSQQSQRDFTTNVSHELKTPLTSIQGFAQAILDGTADSPDAVNQAAQVIHAESERMHRLVLALLDLAGLEAGTTIMADEAIDIDSLLNKVIEKFSPQAAEAQISLTYTQKEFPKIRGDWDRLEQVFTNLVDNAIKFTPSGGSVSLNGNFEKDQIIVEVIDTGEGIGAGEASRIFERFYQVDRSRAGVEGRGTGLGLSIAKEIINAHGGTISVESQLGSGCRFIVRLSYNWEIGYHEYSPQPSLEP
jgi:signal transduction histidine kinase